MNIYERAADILSRLTTTNKYEKPISVLLRARPLLEAVEQNADERVTTADLMALGLLQQAGCVSARWTFDCDKALAYLRSRLVEHERARPLLDAVEKAELYADPETGLGFLRGEDEDAVLRAALAFRATKVKE